MNEQHPTIPSLLWTSLWHDPQDRAKAWYPCICYKIFSSFLPSSNQTTLAPLYHSEPLLYWPISLIVPPRTPLALSVCTHLSFHQPPRPQPHVMIPYLFHGLKPSTEETPLKWINAFYVNKWFAGWISFHTNKLIYINMRKSVSSLQSKPFSSTAWISHI